MERISKEIIESEINREYKPNAYQAGYKTLPFNDLSDRDFEILIYQLIRERIKNSHEIRFDDIALMQGVGEQGRDCCLYKDGQVAGVAQCKKYKERLTKPSVIKEILKFLMYSIVDNTIFPDDISCLNYLLFVSNDFTGPAIELLSKFNTEIYKEDLEKYFIQIKEDYESFKELDFKECEESIKDKINRLRLQKYNSIDIACDLALYPEIIKNYFSIMSISSLKDTEDALRNVLNEFGMNFLTDETLKDFESRIKNIPNENRIKLGAVDFYGYELDYFLKNKELVFSVFKNIFHEKARLDQQILEFLLDKIHTKVIEEITNKLLYKNKIHPFSVQIASPYISALCFASLFRTMMPIDLFKRSFPNLDKSRDLILKDIERKIFKEYEQIISKNHLNMEEGADLITIKEIYNKDNSICNRD